MTNLEQAQLQKLDRIAALLELHGGERILEIGCGWGALAERLIGHYGANVLGITLSAEQLATRERPCERSRTAVPILNCSITAT